MLEILNLYHILINLILEIKWAVLIKVGYVLTIDFDNLVIIIMMVMGIIIELPQIKDVGDVNKLVYPIMK